MTNSEFTTSIESAGSAPVLEVPEARNDGSCKRGAQRKAIAMPVSLIPVAPDGGPALGREMHGRSLDVSRSGIGLEVPSHESMPAYVMGVASANGATRYIGVETRHAVSQSSNLRLGGAFGGQAGRLFQANILEPMFDAPTLGFRMELSDDAIGRWVHLGVLEAATADRVSVCPNCRALPTFRRGCPSCGSVGIVNDRLIHHFACAHVARIADFEYRDELICPKCRRRAIVVGTDFEYLTGPYRCIDCRWSGNDMEHIGQCLRCGLRFPGHQALEIELQGYRANRLDPLDLIQDA